MADLTAIFRRPPLKISATLCFHDGDSAILEEVAVVSSTLLAAIKPAIKQCKKQWKKEGIWPRHVRDRIARNLVKYDVTDYCKLEDRIQNPFMALDKEVGAPVLDEAGFPLDRPIFASDAAEDTLADSASPAAPDGAVTPVLDGLGLPLERPIFGARAHHQDRSQQS